MNDTPAPKPSSSERIAKVIARSGVASRRDAEKMIIAGRVAVNGKDIDSPALDVAPKDKITIDGKPIDAPQETRLWLYYKPLGLVTTEKDDQGRRTIFDEMPEGMPRVLNVGRLDLNSEGLLLLTNDGGLKRRLELPETGWLRKYRVRVNGRPTEATFDPLRRGMTIDGEDFQPMEISLDRQQGANAWLTVGIREGKNREIRRAMAEVGLVVNRLIRLSYGPFRLMDMKTGDVVEVRRRMLRDQLGERLLTGIAPENEEDERPHRDRPRGDRPRGPRPTGERPSFNRDRDDRGRDDKPRSGGFKPRGDAPRGEKPRFNKDRDDRPYGDKPRFNRDRDDRGRDDKPRSGGFKPRGDAPRGDKPRFNKDRDDRPYGDKPRFNRDRDDRGRDDKPRAGGFKPRGDAPRDDKPRFNKDRDDRPYGDKPRFNRDRDDRGRDDKPRSGGFKPRGDAPRGDKPRFNKDRDDRPRSDKPRSAGFKSQGGKPGGPGRSEGFKSHQNGGARGPKPAGRPAGKPGPRMGGKPPRGGSRG
ncbi:rRNA pseudouridine synthase [Thioclava sp. BHET1]|nr:rRNA pseudouridine synthase [Thioclava sp. BHET1]